MRRKGNKARAMCLFLFLAFILPLEGQKMLLLEKAGRVKTEKIFIGQTLVFKLKGEEDYWYKRSVTDMLPESQLLLLDNVPVKIADIAAIKRPKRGFVRLIGGTLTTFGASLAFATTMAAIFRDESIYYGTLYGTAAASGGLGILFLKPRKIKMGVRHRLRIIEISFPPPETPAPVRQRP